MKSFFNNKKLITLLVSLIFFIGILWSSFNKMGSPPFLQQVVSDITAITGRVFSKPIDTLNVFFSDVNQLQNTFEENKRLKSELDSFAELKAELSTMGKENEEMKAELNLQTTLTDYKLITGTVIARNPDMWVDQVIIDLGSKDGIGNGMSVLSNNGLIGRVFEVSPTSSKVVLLTTSGEGTVLTSAEINQEDENIFGVINDYDTDRGYLIMEQITSTAEIEEGLEVTTSGLGGLVPRGLLVGEIVEVSLDRHGLGQRVYIEPAADFENIRFVTIIDRESATIENFNEESEQNDE